MAKKNGAKEEKQELVKQELDTSMERPSWIPEGDRTGLEHFTREDINIPRLAIAQTNSPQLSPEKPNYIDALKVGNLFNTVDGRVFGKGPVYFSIIRSDRPRWVEFAPRESGGGVLDPNVKSGDPRTKWQTDDDGVQHKPKATMFRDYLIVLMPLTDISNPFETVIALSFKSTQLKIAKSLNTKIMARNAPVYTGVYELSVIFDQSNPKGDFYAYQVKNAGWASEADAAALKEMYAQFVDKDVKIDAETENDDAGSDDEM
jgi:hypothetical protein